MNEGYKSSNKFKKNMYRIAYKLGRKIASMILKKRSYFSSKHKIVSFTFDDFPATALENGAKLLESHNVYGTFYASLGIAGTKQIIGDIATHQDLLSLIKNGHELGCHTFSHLDCAFKPMTLIHDDCLKNIKAARSVAGVSLRSFAYPHGSFDPLSKLAVSNIFETPRSIEPGINVNWCDLALLKSVRLYQGDGYENALRWLEYLDRSGGWLIFYTHDIRETPSSFGCSIDLLTKVLEKCNKKKFKILTVAKALSVSTK